MALCRVVPSFDQVREELEERHGAPPIVWACSARPREGSALLPIEEARRELAERRGEAGSRPTLFLLGTGHGLTPEIVDQADALLEPLLGTGSYNHLSVRAAAAIYFHRLMGP